MIFAHKGYKDIPCTNWDEWVKLINDDQTFCKNLRYTRPIKKVKLHELPSWHPYWAKIVAEKHKAFQAELKKKYELCKKDPELIKVYFNLTTTLEDIKNMIDK